MTYYLVLYAVIVVVFLGLDALWLSKVAGPMFRRQLGDMMLDDPKLGVAGGFYTLYCVGLVYFAAGPAQGAPGAAFVDGLLFGLFAYGTYEATNLSTLKRWTPQMAASDVAWGAVLSGASAAIGVAVTGAVFS